MLAIGTHTMAGVSISHAWLNFYIKVSSWMYEHNIELEG